MAFNTHQVKTLVLSFSLCSSSWFSLFSFGWRKYILYCWFKAVGQVSFCHMHRSNWYSYLLNQVLHRFFLQKKKKKKKEGSAQVGRFYTFIHKYVQVWGIDTKKLYLGVFEKKYPSTTNFVQHLIIGHYQLWREYIFYHEHRNSRTLLLYKCHANNWTFSSLIHTPFWTLQLKYAQR